MREIAVLKSQVSASRAHVQHDSLSNRGTCHRSIPKSWQSNDIPGVSRHWSSRL